MNKIHLSRGLWSSILLIVLASTVLLSNVASAQTSPKLVLAYYLLAYPTYSDTVEGYKQDIRDAQALGIDGFVLNVGGWSNPAVSYYQTRAANMFEAAKQLNTGLKLFFSVDMCCGMPASDVVDIVSKYANHSNYLRYNQRPLLGSWMGESLGQDFWQNQVIGKLTANNPLFVPYFYTNHNNADWTKASTENWNNPTYAEVSANYHTWWKLVVGGLQFYAAPGLAEEDATTNEAITQLMSGNGKIFITGIKPYFWEGRINSGEPWLLRRYYETHGGEGMAVQWNSVIDTQQPNIVIVDTWNDFGESYMTPADPALMTLKQYFYNAGPLIRSHAGYAELTKYYISWYKAAIQPAITNDAIYYFYRTHSKELAAPADKQNIILYGPGYTSQALMSTTVPTYGEVLDDIYVTTMLTAQATLKVTSGGVVAQVAVPAGIQHTKVPFTAGTQSFDLIRNGATIIHKDGDAIDATITAYNFTTTSGFGYGAVPADATRPSTPINVAGTAVSSSQINLTWSASTDNVGVTGYNVYRNGTKVGTSLTTFYSDSGLSAGTTYSCTVSAYDAAGNISAQSGVSVSTPAALPPAFAIGVRVHTTSTVNVRSKPVTNSSSKSVGIQYAGSLGGIVLGPQQNSGYTWWQINFDSGADGWVTQDYLSTTMASAE